MGHLALKDLIARETVITSQVIGAQAKLIIRGYERNIEEERVEFSHCLNG